MRRSAYTLIEVLLALAIAVLLLGALYVAVDIQLRTAQAGRDKVEQSTVSRTIFNRLDSDAACVLGLADTARFRIKVSNASSSSSGGSTGGSTTGATTGASATGSTSGSSSTSSSASVASQTTDGTVSTYTNANSVQVVILPYGVKGDGETLHLFVSRVPREMINAQLQQQEGSVPTVGDLRRVSYWLLDGGGLAKQEAKVVTADDAGAVEATMLPPNVDNPNQFLFVAEVKSLQFEYFDGTNWTDTWDSTQPGVDLVTPLGSPPAIRITVGITQVGKPEAPPKQYQHVITFPTANGTTVMPQTGQQQTTPSTTGGGTTSP